MELVKDDKKGKTRGGTDYTVASFRPTKKILPAKRVSLEIVKTPAKPNGLVRIVRKIWG